MSTDRGKGKSSFDDNNSINIDWSTCHPTNCSLILSGFGFCKIPNLQKQNPYKSTNRFKLNTILIASSQRTQAQPHKMYSLVFGLLLAAFVSASPVTDVETRIINGQLAAFNQFPWHVYIQGRLNDNRQTLCGGALVGQLHILTSASCVDGHQWVICDALNLCLLFWSQFFRSHV